MHDASNLASVHVFRDACIDLGELFAGDPVESATFFATDEEMRRRFEIVLNHTRNSRNRDKHTTYGFTEVRVVVLHKRVYKITNMLPKDEIETYHNPTYRARESRFGTIPPQLDRRPDGAYAR